MNHLSANTYKDRYEYKAYDRYKQGDLQLPASGSSRVLREGVTISGGEPFQQPKALLDLQKHLAGSGLSCLVFTGYTLKELRSLPLGPQVLAHVDVLIAGRYVASLHLGHGLLGSANQKIHLLAKRYKAKDFTYIPAREIILHLDGTVTLSGIDPCTQFTSDCH